MKFENKEQQAEYEKYVKLPLGKETVEILKPISKDYDFIVGALAICRTERQRQKLIQEIKSKNITKYGEICHTCCKIHKGEL